MKTCDCCGDSCVIGSDGICSYCRNEIDKERNQEKAISEEEYFKRLEQEERGKS